MNKSFEKKLLEIIIEQLDNGIVFRSREADADDVDKLVLQDNECAGIGQELWYTIKSYMDKEATYIVKINLEIEGIEGIK